MYTHQWNKPEHKVTMHMFITSVPLPTINVSVLMTSANFSTLVFSGMFGRNINFSPTKHKKPSGKFVFVAYTWPLMNDSKIQVD